MEALFTKYFWVIKGLGLAIVAGLAASAVMTQVGTQFALDVAPQSEEEGEGEGEDEDEDLDFGDNPFRSKASSRRKTSSVSVAKRKTADDIQERNIFCPTCVPVQDAAPSGNVPLGDDGQPVGLQPGEVKSKLPLQLMATMEATDPEYSLATVYDAENQISGLYGRGDAIRPTVTVVGVDAGIVHLRNNAALEYIELGDDVQAPKSTRGRNTKKKDDDKKKKKRRSSRHIEGAEEAIDCANENSCTVDREFVEKLMSNPAMLAKQARIVPSQKNGETQGFKFYGIRRGSLPKLLGLKNGDMLTEVNGEEIRSVDQAMSLAMKLRRASNLSVTLVRKGKPMSKEIQIQ